MSSSRVARRKKKGEEKDKMEENVQIKKDDELKTQEPLGRRLNKIALFLLPCAIEQRVKPWQKKGWRRDDPRQAGGGLGCTSRRSPLPWKKKKMNGHWRSDPSWLEPSLLIMSIIGGSGKSWGRSSYHFKPVFPPAVVIELVDVFFHRSYR